MRTAKINKKGLFVANFDGERPILDKNGYETGEKRIVYTQPRYFKANISGARGSANNEVFGTDISYDKSISMSMNLFEELGIDENSVFFVDSRPNYDEEEPLYDYVVSRISQSINEVVIAISKVRK